MNASNEKETVKEKLKVFLLNDNSHESESDIVMILNENTDTFMKIKSEEVLITPHNKFYVFNLPRMESLLDRNSVRFELCSSHIQGWFSPQYNFNKNDKLSYYFMLNAKFQKDNRTFECDQNEGQSLFTFFLHLIEISNKNIENTLNIFQDLLCFLNELSYTDYSYNLKKLLDEFIISHEKENIPSFLMTTCLYQAAFSNVRDVELKYTSILLNRISKADQENLQLFSSENLKVLKQILADGVISLVKLTIIEGSSEWLQLANNDNFNKYLFNSDEKINNGTKDNLYQIILDLLRGYGYPIKNKEEFNEVKSFLIRKYKSNDKDNFTNESIIRSVSALASCKEDLISFVEELAQMNLIKLNSIQVIKDEMRRKKWELDTDENIVQNVNRLVSLVDKSTNLKFFLKEYNNLIYELTPSLRYLLLVIKSIGVNLDLPLARSSLNYIRLYLDDYFLLVREMHQIPKEIRSELFDIYFYEKLKDCFGEISLPFYSETQKEILMTILLSEGLFPNGSLDFIKGILNNKPNFEDLSFIIKKLILPQKKHGEEQIKNIFSSINKDSGNIYEIINNFNLIIKLLNDDTDSVLKASICEDFWSTINKRYSMEIILSLSKYFDSNTNIFGFLHVSYSQFISKLIESFSSDIKKINQFFTSLSSIDFPTKELHLVSNNTATANIIASVLDILNKNSKPDDFKSHFLLENPSKENFWYKLLTVTGSCLLPISTHSYLNKMYKCIKTTFEDIVKGNLTMSEFITLSKQNETQRDTLVTYIRLAHPDSERHTILYILTNQINHINNCMHIMNEIEKFLSVYGRRIDKKCAEDYINFIRNAKQNLKNILFSQFKFSKEIDKNKDILIEINKWGETISFNNIFRQTYIEILNNKHTGGIKKTFGVIEDYPLIQLEEFIQIAQGSIKLLQENICSLVKVKDFNHMSLKFVNSTFKNLADSEKEYHILCTLMNFRSEEEKENLKKILKNIAEVSIYAKFSFLMIKLNNTYKFIESNEFIYKNFLIVIQEESESNLDSVIEKMESVRKIKRKITQEYEIENIILEMSENKDLLEFVNATPEEDIRNMVDAVDEHGDSFIRVQTIRDLLIIGSFIRMLKLKEKIHSEETFIECIVKAIDDNPSFSTIDVLINSCSKHYIGIKLLHSELSNREEASKFKTKEIVLQSVFSFILSEKIACKLVYEITISYSNSKKKISYRDLCDLRDRVLLLLNNEKANAEGVNNISDQSSTLNSFIRVVELSEKILLTLNELISNGFPLNLSRQVKLTEGNYEPFQDLLNEISNLSTRWNEDLKEAYKQYYSLTYFKGHQFWELEKLFRENVKEQDLLNTSGFYLIKYACSDITINSINKFKYENDVIELLPPNERIRKLGKVLDQLIDVKKNGAKAIKQDANNKISLNVPTDKILFSTPSTLKIYSHLLSLHFTKENLLPSENQILYCLPTTSFPELISFLYRYAFCSVNRLFTIIRVENLPFEMQSFLVEQINNLMKRNSITERRVSNISVICCDRNSFIHRQLSENASYVYTVKEIEIMDESTIIKILKRLNLNIYVIRSNDTGAGKTHRIQKLCGYDPNVPSNTYINFPIMDSINIDSISQRLYLMNTIRTMKTIHMSISGVIDNYESLDYILFKFIFLGCFKHGVQVSFRNKDDPIFLEIANSYNNFLFNAVSILNLIPQTETIISKDILKTIDINTHSTKDSNPLQLVCNYLYHYDGKTINMVDIHPDKQWRKFSKDECIYLLNKFFIKDKPDVTFRQVWIFINVLATQLTQFSNNLYFTCENIKFIQDDSLKEIRMKILESLLLMTEEFTTRSIKGARESQKQTTTLMKMNSKSDINNPDFRREELNDVESRLEEIDAFSSILSWSKNNHLLIMFHSDGMCVTPVYRVLKDVPHVVANLVESQKSKLEDYQKTSHQILLHKLLGIVGKSYQEYIFKNNTYMLTADNFLKMLLIITRARANIPIVIMGETGCGKTSLIRFLTKNILQEALEVINFHAGFKESDIIDRMNEIVLRALTEYHDTKLWVFLDEINTCDYLGLITEIICQKTMMGVALPRNLIFISACNPYKIRKDNSDVGLIKQRNSTRLIYRVHPLPDSLIDFIWDYGSLSDTEELLYIANMLSNISGSLKSEAVGVVIESHVFMRAHYDRYSVSLRDVSRFKTLHEWFFKMIDERTKNSEAHCKDNSENLFDMNTKYQPNLKYTGKGNTSKKALILSLMMCYYNRIEKNYDRKEYKKLITKHLNMDERVLEEIVSEEQRDIISRMELPNAIAINKALLENVFALLVCVINKIPLFICGKPGCSKSLSVQLLVSNLRGRDSTDIFFKKLPRILAVPYQGSESSMSEGIERVFEKANNITKNESGNSEILPLLVFDEIGLAEISKNNPLKILHSLLEPESPSIAFVGLSNWRLDASKMNRAIYLARPDPDLEDLENTAVALFQYYIKHPRYDEIYLMKALAGTYFEFKNAQALVGNTEFHGTRDFYSLIKQVTHNFSKSYSNYHEMKYRIIKDALLRNFGGIENSAENILHIFSKLSDEFLQIPTKSTLELIKENLRDKDARYLLLFTNGSSASYILDNYIKNDMKDRIVLTGSQFEDDRDKEEHSFRTLSDIILYMESGESIIMKNLDQIYGSLYDLFNQNFMIVGQKKNCRIALGSTNNPMCFIKDNFHCVVLVDIKEMHQMDPPFLNRFEKQILTFDSVLNNRQILLVKEVNKWIMDLTDVEITSTRILDLIVTYNTEEFVQSIILQHYSEEKSNEQILEETKESIISLAGEKFIIHSAMSKMFQNSRDEITKIHHIYFEKQCHNSLSEYLNKVNDSNKLIVYTYSNILEELNLTDNNIAYASLNVGEIKTEKDFDLRFNNFLKSPNCEWMIIKVDSLKESVHIPMIKFKTDKLINEYMLVNNLNSINKHVILVVHMSKRNSSSSLESQFLSGWQQITIDNINGGEVEKLKKVLNLSTIELIESFIDQKIINEIVWNVYMKLNYEVVNQAENEKVREHIKEVLQRLDSKDDREMFNIIIKKAIACLKNKELPDWKEKVCSDTKIMAKSLNTFQAIKFVIAEILEEPFVKIVYLIESESAFDSFYFGENRRVWKEILDGKKLNEISQYNGVQSLVINPVFNLLFPFSRNDIYEISKAIGEHVDSLYIIDNSCYFNLKMDDESLSNYRSAFGEIENYLLKNCLLHRIKNKIENLEDYHNYEVSYIKDLITYFTTVELKLQSKWVFLLTSLIQKYFSFDVSNLPHILIFLYKNKTTFDYLLQPIISLCRGEINFCNAEFAESLLNQTLSYNANLFNNERKRITEINIFNSIFNAFVKVLLSQLNFMSIIKEKVYSAVLNDFINSLTNFSLEIKEHPESLIVLKAVNEFLKLLSIIIKRDDCYMKEVSKNTKGIFNEDFNKINLKDFYFVRIILNLIEENKNNILEKHYKNCGDDREDEFTTKITENVTNAKLCIFENILLGKLEFTLKQIIVNNILNDNHLLRHSSMIFYRLFSEYKIDETFNQIENCELKIILERILMNDDIYTFDHIAYSFLPDFFRKFLTRPTTQIESYLITNYDNFVKYINFCNADGRSFQNILGIAGLKHYLEIFSEYLTCVIKKSQTGNEDLLIKINSNLENNSKQNVQIKSIEVMDAIRNYILKCLMRFTPCTSQGLSNINYEEIKVKWINSKVFENNDNCLGLEPNLPELDLLNREYSLFFVELVNEDKSEYVEKFKEIILDASDKPCLKFVIIQFFISKVYLSFSNRNYANSLTYKHIIKIFELVSKDIRKHLGVITYNFIFNLVHNFPKKSELFTRTVDNNSSMGVIAFLMQCYNLILSFEGDMHFSLKNIFSIRDWKKLFIPGGFVEYQDENILVIMKEVDEQFSIYGTQIGLYECSCGYLYTIGNCTRPYVVFPCPMCHEQIGGTGHVLVNRPGHICLINADNRSEANLKEAVLEHLQLKTRNRPGYVTKMADELGKDYKIRGLSQIGFRFFNLFTHGVLLLMIENLQITAEEVQAVIGNTINVLPTDYLLRHINSDMTKLSEIVNSRDYFIVLIQILNSLFILSKENYNMTFTTTFDRERLENLLQNKYINNIVTNLGQVIQQYRQTYSLERKITYLSILDENFTEEQGSKLPNRGLMKIFRSTRLGNWTELRTEHLKNTKNNMFLKLLIEKIEEMSQLTNLSHIVEFTNYMIKNLNFKLTRQEAKEIKIREFLDVLNNPLHKKLWENFESSWRNVSLNAIQFACKILPRLNTVDLDLPVSFFLVDDRELGYGMYMAAAFQHLGMIQNEVLEAIVYLIKSDSHYQSWSNMDNHRYPIQKISPSEIILHQTELNYVSNITETYARFYDVFNDKFGPEGSLIQYNFDKIENELASKLLTNKKILNYEDLTKIQYKFELLSIQNKNSNLVNVIRSKGKQINFNSDEISSLRTSLEKLEAINVAYLHQIFSSLEIVLCQMKYSNSIEDLTIAQFSEIIKTSLTENISPLLNEKQPFCSVKLNKILSFYQLIEEMLFKYVLEYVSPDYKKPLNEESKENVKEFLKAAEKDTMGYPSTNQIIKTVQRFIIRCLVAFVEPKFPLKDYLMRTDLWDIEVKEEVIDTFYFEFPDDLLIANTVSLLHCLNEFKKQKEE